jgi:branched-chain amino acid transport system ATP-binding protein
MGEMDLLTVENVTAGYTAVPVLQGVSLRADPGEIVAILGANGAGKTTLLRVISGLMSPRGGRVFLDGKPIQKLPTQKIARMGVAHVIEARGVLPNLTIEENILLGLLGTGQATKRRCKAALELATGYFPWISARLGSYGGQLSGGQQQMVAISRALATEPRVLLLDEPSLGIAPALVDEIYSKIELIVKDERAVVIVEQHIHKALSVASRGYVVRRGSIVLEGTTTELASNPQLAETYFS